MKKKVGVGVFWSFVFEGKEKTGNEEREKDKGWRVRGKKINRGFIHCTLIIYYRTFRNSDSFSLSLQ